MKKIITSMLILLTTGFSYGQTFNEWFRQKKTQKKYLIEQIAAAKIYAGYLKKGYNIGKEGLGIITRIKDGDFNLHRDFFGSLAAVNPSVKKYPRVAEIISLQQRITDQQDKTLDHLSSSNYCSPVELQYFKRVFSRLLENCGHDLGELIDLTRDGALVMKDDQRLQRIDKIYAATVHNYSFCKEFGLAAIQLVAGREKAGRAISKMKIVGGL